MLCNKIAATDHACSSREFEQYITLIIGEEESLFMCRTPCVELR